MSVLQIETSVSHRFRVIFTGIQGAILGGQNPLFKHLKNISNTERCPNAVYCWDSVADSNSTLSIGPIL